VSYAQRDESSQSGFLDNFLSPFSVDVTEYYAIRLKVNKVR
jgi:hypothetical protein